MSSIPVTRAGTATSAVVTGAARGIGRGVAERLVTRGYRVVVTDLDGDAAARTAAEIGAAAGLAQDVRDPGSHATVAEAAQAVGRLAVWVNNAGLGHDGDLVDLSEEQVRALVEVNLLGTLWGMRTALAALGPDGGARPHGGDLVNVASLSGLGPVPGLSTYAATKAAVVSATSSVAIEAPAGVRVHAVLPDGVATDMVAGMSDQGRGKQLVHSGGRLLTVDETADATVGLIGSDRVLRTVPAWRAAVMRTAALAPSVAGRGVGLLAAHGARHLRR